MAISIKQVLISERQMEAIKRIQEKQHEKLGVGVAPTLHEIARGLVDKMLTDCMRKWVASRGTKIY